MTEREVCLWHAPPAASSSLCILDHWLGILSASLRSEWSIDIWHCIEHLASATAAMVLSIQRQRSHPFPFRRLKLQRSHYPTSSSVEVRAKRRGSLRKRSLIQNRPAREKKPWKCHKHFINEPKKKMKHNKSKWLLANFGPPNHRLKSIWICIP